MSNSFLVTLIVIICLILCSCNITREVTSLHSDGSEGLYESSEESVQPEQVVEFLSLADTVVANSVGIDGTEYEYTFYFDYIDQLFSDEPTEKVVIGVRLVSDFSMIEDARTYFESVEDEYEYAFIDGTVVTCCFGEDETVYYGYDLQRLLLSLDPDFYEVTVNITDEDESVDEQEPIVVPDI